MGIREVINEGIKKHQARDLDGALKIYNAVLGRVVTEPYLLHLVGTAFIDMQLYGVAMQLLMRCIETSPHDAEWLPETYMNLGVALRNEAHEVEAMACYRRTIEMKPNYSTAWGNLSGVFINYGLPEKCIELAEKALSIDPKNIQARHHRALALLELEQYEIGFKEYECRLELPEFHKRNYDGPMWDGKPIGTLVVHGEQGLGDEVMFCSLIQKCKERADRVVIEANHRLVSLFERSFNVKVYPSEEEIKKHEKGDAWIPMGSLPYVFGVNGPQNFKPYLKPDPKRAAKYKHEGFRVGLSWRGGTKKTHEHLRNFEIEDWKKLLEPSFEWASLQYGDVKHELEEMKLVDLGWNGFDMEEFAAMVESCDLIITVCNTTVHFAGAIGKPCWVLVPSKPAWRYGIKSDRMLFYPNNKMYRQGKDEPWSSVIERVKKDLIQLKEKVA